VSPPRPQLRSVFGRRLRGVALAAMLSAAAATSLPSATGRAAPAAGPGEPAPRRVLLIVDRADDPFAERIRAEVAGLGLTAVMLEPWRTHATLGPLETVARSQRAVAAIRMVPSRKGVEVWMADETSGRSLLRQLVVDESPGGPNQSLIALQTAELLRTSLLSRPGAPTAPGAPKSTAPTVPAGETTPTLVAGPEVAAEPLLGLDAALGVLFAPRGGSAALQAWLSVQHSIAPRWLLALDLSAPLRAASLSGPEGSARVGAYLAGLTLAGRVSRVGSPLLAIAGLGLGVLDLRADGQTTAPLQATHASSVTGTIFARADASLEVVRWLRLGLRAVAGVTTSAIQLDFAGNDAGTWGQPFVGGLGLVDLSWP
jgi:hypothetical protein